MNAVKFGFTLYGVDVLATVVDVDNRFPSMCIEGQRTAHAWLADITGGEVKVQGEGVSRYNPLNIENASFYLNGGAIATFSAFDVAVRVGDFAYTPKSQGEYLVILIGAWLRAKERSNEAALEGPLALLLEVMKG